MKPNRRRVLSTGLPPTIALLTFAMSGGVSNAYNAGGCWTDSSGNIVQSRYGGCVQAREWPPQYATSEHDSTQDKPPTAVAVVTEYVIPVNVIYRTAIDTETYFAFDSAEFNPQAESALSKIADKIQRLERVDEIRVLGHADRIGPEQYNEELALTRAEKVERYLADKTQIKSSKFVVRAEGEADPQVKCTGFESTENLIDCLQPNRRVEIEVLGAK